MALSTRNRSLPFGCMTYYDMVVHTEAELNMINDMKSCLENLKSEKYRGQLMDMIQSYHAEKRLVPFIYHFNSFRGQTAYEMVCTCTKLDSIGDLDCMHPTGKFDIRRVQFAFDNGHCLICGTYDLADGICEHRALFDDCKMVAGGRGRLANPTDEFERQLRRVLRYDAKMHTWEQTHVSINSPPEDMVLQREWRAERVEAEVVLQNLKMKREEEQHRVDWLSLAMGQHPRLGANSQTNGMRPEIIAMIMAVFKPA